MKMTEVMNDITTYLDKYGDVSIYLVDETDESIGVLIYIKEKNANSES